MKALVLDHGYVQTVEHWGSDERIIEAARMSTAKGFEGWGPFPCICTKTDNPGCMWEQQNTGTGSTAVMVQCKKCKGTEQVLGDEKLLRFLYTHKHTTPFEMGGATFEVQAPIFVFREWHRHRTQSYNEMSARYTPLPDLNYIPTIARLMQTSNTNKQAMSIGRRLTEQLAGEFIANLENEYKAQQGLYELALEAGVPKELARLVLPVGRYSKMRASANLWNWLRFLKLRLDPNAQYEIRQYAEVIQFELEQQFPRTMELFREEFVNGR